jgi:hypothetical protein
MPLIEELKQLYENVILDIKGLYVKTDRTR